MACWLQETWKPAYGDHLSHVSWLQTSHVYASLCVCWGRGLELGVAWACLALSLFVPLWSRDLSSIGGITCSWNNKNPASLALCTLGSIPRVTWSVSSTALHPESTLPAGLLLSRMSMGPDCASGFMPTWRLALPLELPRQESCMASGCEWERLGVFCRSCPVSEKMPV